jgi:hypothetical protein
LTGDAHNHNSAFIRNAVHRQRGADAACPFAHAQEAEASVLAAIGHRRLHTDTIVRDAEREIASVVETDVKPTTARMHARISNSFVADAIDFIADNGMHFLWIASDRKVPIDGPLAAAVVYGAGKRLRKIIPFCRRQTQGVDSGTSLVPGLGKPGGDLL